MIWTIGNLWYLIVIATIGFLLVWYWSVRASHRMVERMSHSEPERFNFSFRRKKNRQ